MDTTLETPPESLKVDLAKALWARRGSPQNDEPEKDWRAAEDILSDPWVKARLCPRFTAEDVFWLLWAKRTLRPYLAIESVADANGLADQLKQAQQALGSTAAKGACVLALVDGAPEFSRSRYRPYAGNDRQADAAVAAIELKDQSFYRFCYTTFGVSRGILLDQGAVSLESMTSPKPRKYQDGCAAVFAASLNDAVAASLRLRLLLSRHNVAENLLWSAQVHLRVGIGATWDKAIHCLSHCQRDEILVAEESMATFEPIYHQICIAAGVKPGPSKTASFSPQEAYDALSQHLRDIPGEDSSEVSESNTLGGRRGQRPSSTRQ